MEIEHYLHSYSGVDRTVALIREGFEPFRPKTDILFLTDYDFNWLEYRVFVEFPGVPVFNHDVRYPDKRFYDVATDDLFVHFGMQVADHIRNFRIEPEDNIELGEN